MDSFSDDEKRFVLAEMIKTSAVDINDMVAFLKSHGIVPDWEEMQVPRGRNLKQCKEAAHVLGFSVPPQLVWNQQPHSLVPTRPQPPIQQKARHQQYIQEQHNNNHINSQTNNPPKTESRKRKSSVDSADQAPKRMVLPSLEMHTSSTTRLRELKPKASENDNPFDSPPTPRQRPSAPLQNGPRRRGRPSKEETHARASLAAAPAATVSTIPLGANEPTSVAKAESLSKAGVAIQADSQPRGLSSEDVEDKNIRDSSPYSERSSARP